MQKRVLPLLLAALLLLCACSGTAEPNQATNREEPVMDLDYSKVSAIRLRDLAEDQFEQPLDQLLEPEETAALLNALSQASPKELPIGGVVLYALDLLDADGAVLSSCLVDNDVTLEFACGPIYRRSGELDLVLRGIEGRLGVRDALYTRRPGPGYFSLFSRVDHGYLYEITENNFIQGLTKNLGQEDIAALQASLEGVRFSEKRVEQVPSKFIVELYSTGGGLVYQFSFDAEGHVYSLEYYELLGTTLGDWLSAQQG